MSEPLARARRVVAVGAAALVVVIVALAAAAWRLVDEETASAARRGRIEATLAAEDLVRALAATVDHEARCGAVLSRDGSIFWPEAPRRFAPMPSLDDSEGAFLIRESEDWSPSLRRAALRRAATSRDDATRVAAAAAGMRLDLRERADVDAMLTWRNLASEPVRFEQDFLSRDPLGGTRDAVLLRMMRTRSDGADYDLSRSEIDVPAALPFVGGADDLDAASMIAAIVPRGTTIVRQRRAELRESTVLAAAWKTAPEIDGSSRAAMFADGSAAVARRVIENWYVVRMPPNAAGETAVRVLEPRGMRLVAADAASMPAAVPFPGDGPWAIAASFSESETRSRSTLLVVGLGVAAGAAILAFVAFARSARREARLATLRTDFVATVSHELRTPVAVVRTSAETLASGRATKDDDKRALTEAIVRESERLSTLVGNVLDFARMESGRRTYAKRSLDVGALVREVASWRHGVAVEVADDVPSIAGDADALGAAVGNLLDNARKYSPPGAPVSVRVAKDGGDVVVEVMDHGIGVPDGEKPHVFERFFRGADPRVRETRGAGIGLALVKHAAEAHGGRVEVADTPGGGATFRVRLPVGENG